MWVPSSGRGACGTVRRQPRLVAPVAAQTGELATLPCACHRQCGDARIKHTTASTAERRELAPILPSELQHVPPGSLDHNGCVSRVLVGSGLPLPREEGDAGRSEAGGDPPTTRQAQPTWTTRSGKSNDRHNRPRQSNRIGTIALIAWYPDADSAEGEKRSARSHLRGYEE